MKYFIRFSNNSFQCKFMEKKALNNKHHKSFKQLAFSSYWLRGSTPLTRCFVCFWADFLGVFLLSLLVLVTLVWHEFAESPQTNLVKYSNIIELI